MASCWWYSAVTRCWKTLVKPGGDDQSGQIIDQPTPLTHTQVGSYQLKWGGVSGYLEHDDTSLSQRALIEAAEEVGLSSDSLQFIRAGRPLIVDGGPSRQFAVHPVLLHMTQDKLHDTTHSPTTPPSAQTSPVSTPSITLNWENIAYQWVDQEHLPTLPHVPQLPETAARVLLDAQVQGALQWLEGDRAHGAAELAVFVLDAMQGMLLSWQLWLGIVWGGLDTALCVCVCVQIAVCVCCHSGVYIHNCVYIHDCVCFFMTAHPCPNMHQVLYIP